MRGATKIKDGFARLLQERYDDIAGLLDQCIWETDRELRFIYLSENTPALAGLPRDRLLATTLRDMLSTGEPPQCAPRAGAALNIHAPFDEVIQYGSPAANLHSIRLAGVPVVDDRGVFSGYRGVGKVITDEETRSFGSTSQYRLLTDAIESQSAGLTIYDRDDRLIFWNSAYVALCPGIEEIISPGMHFDEAAHALHKHSVMPDVNGNNSDFVEMARRHHRGQQAPMELSLRDGRWILVDSQRTASGGAICLHTDITERKEAEISLAQLEHRFALAFQFNPGMTAITEIENGNLIAVNNKWLNAFGWSQEEVIGGSVLELDIWTHPDERAQFIEKLRSEGRVLDFQAQHCTRAGEVLDVLIAGETIELEGKPHLLICSQDISERKRINDTLKQSEARFSEILKIIPEAVIILDHSLRIMSFNGGAERTFGYDEAEALGKPVDFLIPEHLRKSHDKLVKGFVSSGERSHGMGQRGRICGLRKDGAEFPAEASISRLQLGGETLFAVLLLDVTAQYEAEQALHAAKEEAEFSSRAKSEFLANMSHELRTPLNAIMGFSQVIRDNTLGPAGNGKYRGYAQDIYNSGKHLLEIIGDILDLAKIDDGHARIDDEEIDVRHVLDSCVKLMRGSAESAGVILTADYREPQPLLRADSRRVTQIVINLLSNAIKFTPAGGSVLLTAGLGEKSEFLLTVADTGIGMKPEDIPLVFELFHQVEHSLTRKREGTGLGLPLAKKLCELHNASIDIESAPNRGTTVRIGFPPTRTVWSRRRRNL